MRRVILFMMTTLDGYVEGAHGELDWHRVDDEFNDFAAEQLSAADGVIFGRATYDLMAGYWPTAAARTDDPVIAAKMNAIPKYVFSKTLPAVDWDRTHLIQTDAPAAVAALKQQPGRNLLIFGSSTLTASLAHHRLIDEYRLMVNPIVLGHGKPLLQGIATPLSLKLQQSRTFATGNVLLTYGPE